MSLFKQVAFEVMREPTLMGEYTVIAVALTTTFALGIYSTKIWKILTQPRPYPHSRYDDLPLRPLSSNSRSSDPTTAFYTQPTTMYTSSATGEIFPIVNTKSIKTEGLIPEIYYDTSEGPISTLTSNTVSVTESDTSRRKRKRKRCFSDSDDSDSDSDSVITKEEKQLSKALKSSLPDISPFDGNPETWMKWKTSTKAILYATGFERIMNDKRQARKQRAKNMMLYTFIYTALNEGSAAYVQHQIDDQDGQKYWWKLVSMYEGDEYVTSGVANSLKNKLRDCILVPGVSAHVYIGRFMKLYTQIQKHEGFTLNIIETKQLFIKNIKDPDFTNFAASMQYGMKTSSLEELQNKLRFYEQDMEKSSAAARGRYSSSGSVKKVRRMEEGNGNEPTSLPSKIETDTKGTCSIRPEIWHGLSRSDKEFILQYNAAVKLNNKLPSPPEGVTIVAREEQPTNDTCRKRRAKSSDYMEYGNIRVRRTGPPTHRSSIPATDGNDSTDSEDLDAALTPGKRRVTFHLRPEPNEKNATPSTSPARPRRQSYTGQPPRQYNNRIRRQCSLKPGEDRFICDSGGGKRPTITERAWLTVGDDTGLTTGLQPYQTATATRHPVVSAVTKAMITGRDEPVLLLVHYATYISNKHDPNEVESLLTTMDLGNHGVTINGIHPSSKKCGITVDQTFLPFDWDDDSVFYRISKPTEAELSIYTVFELNANRLPSTNRIRRRQGIKRPISEMEFKYADTPISELRKRFAMLPEESIKSTLQNTTQYYSEIQEDNRESPQKHFRKRFKAFHHNRQRETVATDFVYLGNNSSQGHTGGQFFSGITSKKWEFYPLKKESQCTTALQDYIRTHGPPEEIRSDNAQSENGASWTTILRDNIIKSSTSEPHYQHQNHAEPEWGRLGKMIQNCMRSFDAPGELWNWCAKYCCQINNVTSRKSLNWRTPWEISTGTTPDISKFRFHFYEPLWYFAPVKTPKNNMLKARYLAIAESCGDAFTYYILTEPDKGRRQVLMRSVVKTRRKHIGMTTEYVNNNPNMESFTMSLEEATRTSTEFETTTEVPIILPGEKIADPDPRLAGTTISSDEEDDEDGYETDTDPEEHLPPTTDATNHAESHQTIVETVDANIDSDMSFRKIINHCWENGMLILKAQYYDDLGGLHTIDSPLILLRKDEPIPCAKYIKAYILEDGGRRGDRPLNDWANHTLTVHGNTVRRMKSVDPTWRSKHEDVNTNLRRTVTKCFKRVRRVARKKQQSQSRNQRNAEQSREKFGIRIPNTIHEALKMDKEAGNTKWADAIKKEMDNLDRLEVFKYFDNTKAFDPNQGWQKAPLRMIFDIKSEDHRYKARLVVGGHKVDSSAYNTYASQVDTLSVLLLFLVCKHQKLSLMTADVSTAFPTAPTSEKVWCTAGPEFGPREGSKIEIQRAMYGLAGSARAFADFLADSIRRLGFTPSRADPDLWIKKMPYGYDYIATHVDDLIVVSKNPQDYIACIEQEFALRNVESEPSSYLGTSLCRIKDGRIMMNSKKYITECIRKYESKYGTTLKKQPIPMPVSAHPELDGSPLLSLSEHKEFQHIVGLGQWIILTGRIDITYAISSLARFAAGPREGHLTLARHVLGYLKKFKSKGIVMDPRPPNITPSGEDVKWEDFGHQYKYYTEEMDPFFPDPTVNELATTIFCDSDHAHDLVTGRSITGLIAFVGSTPVHWKSKRQTSVHTSTFGAEFMALKSGVELAITLRYHLRSMGVEITQPTKIFVDNQSVCINSTNPASTLNKKSVALSYHFVRQHQAGNVVSVIHIGTDDNYADILTKPLPSNKFREHIWHFNEKFFTITRKYHGDDGET